MNLHCVTCGVGIATGSRCDTCSETQNEVFDDLVDRYEAAIDRKDSAAIARLASVLRTFYPGWPECST